MGYAKGIFERANLQHIRSFLQYEVESGKISDKSYEERIKESKDKTFKFLKENFPDINEDSEPINLIVDYNATAQEVYMEIGMQCGAFLMLQLLENFYKE